MAWVIAQRFLALLLKVLRRVLHVALIPLLVDAAEEVQEQGEGPRSVVGGPRWIVGGCGAKQVAEWLCDDLWGRDEPGGAQLLAVGVDRHVVVPAEEAHAAAATERREHREAIRQHRQREVREVHVIRPQAHSAEPPAAMTAAARFHPAADVTSASAVVVQGQSYQVPSIVVVVVVVAAIAVKFVEFVVAVIVAAATLLLIILATTLATFDPTPLLLLLLLLAGESPE